MITIFPTDSWMLKSSSGAFFRLAATESDSVAFGYSSPHHQLLLQRCVAVGYGDGHGVRKEDLGVNFVDDVTCFLLL
ncbi:uncharacterized protein G2W53_018293 [Senna tora]|uniref:Uncharacterized protein n=1 Tax=Senna tora TaxID=362788 RepID=A0A834U0A8_9FABA|nr:uncharacterized protein G2W53_018293 [Senna tora]